MLLAVAAACTFMRFNRRHRAAAAAAAAAATAAARRGMPAADRLLTRATRATSPRATTAYLNDANGGSGETTPSALIQCVRRACVPAFALKRKLGLWWQPNSSTSIIGHASEHARVSPARPPAPPSIEQNMYEAAPRDASSSSTLAVTAQLLRRSRAAVKQLAQLGVEARIGKATEQQVLQLNCALHCCTPCCGTPSSTRRLVAAWPSVAGVAPQSRRRTRRRRRDHGCGDASPGRAERVAHCDLYSAIRATRELSRLSYHAAPAAAR